MVEQQERRSVAERREQLIDAAINVLAREGMDAATTRRITDEAGLALGAFHYAFRNKDDLLQAVIERISHGIERTLQNTIVEPDQSLEEFGTQVARTYWDFIEQSSDLQLARYELTIHALRNDNLRSLAQQQVDRLSEAVELALSDHPDLHDTEHRREVAAYLVAILDGLMLHRIIEGDLDAAQQRVSLFLASFPQIAEALRRGVNGLAHSA